MGDGPVRLRPSRRARFQRRRPPPSTFARLSLCLPAKLNTARVSNPWTRASTGNSGASRIQYLSTPDAPSQSLPVPPLHVLRCLPHPEHLPSRRIRSRSVLTSLHRSRHHRHRRKVRKTRDILISVHQSTNKEKKPSGPPLGSPMPPRPLVTRDTADRNATQYEDLDTLGDDAARLREYTHAHDGFALLHRTYLTLESDPYDVPFHTGPQSCHLPPTPLPRVCASPTPTYPRVPLSTVGVAWKVVPGPGARFAVAHVVIAAFNSGTGFRTPPPHHVPSSCCSRPALHPCRTYRGSTVMIMV